MNSIENRFTLLNGNSAEVLKQFPDNHFDSIVTDPPYGIDFLGKSWDANTGALEIYQECLRVLKPGGHLLAFSAARTYHHLAYTVEVAGFEIRDQIMWLYSSGFPKSQDVGKSIERSEKKRKDNALGIKRSKIASGPKTNCPKCNKTLNGSNQKSCEEAQCDLRDALSPANNEWAGWGTALKPAHEPIVVARKPLKQSVAKNVQVWGTGALNIDATRIAATDLKEGTMGKAPPNLNAIGRKSEIETSEEPWIPSELGRFPSNVLGIVEGYQKYFYCPKVGRNERHAGFDTDSLPTTKGGKYDTEEGAALGRQDIWQDGNHHPTVKPQKLMEYLVKLVTPPNGLVLDPFNGSGSTGMAAVKLGHTYVGIDLDPKYIEISRKRIVAWNEPDNTYSQLFEDDGK